MKVVFWIFVVLLSVSIVFADSDVNDSYEEGSCGITFSGIEPIPGEDFVRNALIVGLVVFVLGLIGIFSEYRQAAIIIVGLALVIAVASFAYLQVYPVVYRDSDGVGLVGQVHYHFDFSIFINGVKVNFETSEQSSIVHIHDNLNVIHSKARGVTVRHVMDMLNGSVSSECLEWNLTSYCNDDSNSVKMYVNGRANLDFDSYEFKDIDQIMISYGNESKEDLQRQWLTITDDSCVFSGECPERGPAPEEGCMA